MSKSRARPPHAGGRPLAFIPRLVLEHAAKLYEQSRRWSDVLWRLEASGNGVYPRNTLIRRLERYKLVQNSAELRTPAPASTSPRAPSKTRGRG